VSRVFSSCDAHTVITIIHHYPPAAGWHVTYSRPPIYLWCASTRHFTDASCCRWIYNNYRVVQKNWLWATVNFKRCHYVLGDYFKCWLIFTVLFEQKSAANMRTEFAITWNLLLHYLVKQATFFYSAWPTPRFLWYPVYYLSVVCTSLCRVFWRHGVQTVGLYMRHAAERRFYCQYAAGA